MCKTIDVNWLSSASSHSFFVFDTMKSHIRVLDLFLLFSSFFFFDTWKWKAQTLRQPKRSCQNRQRRTKADEREQKKQPNYKLNPQGSNEEVSQLLRYMMVSTIFLHTLLESHKISSHTSLTLTHPSDRLKIGAVEQEIMKLSLQLGLRKITEYGAIVAPLCNFLPFHQPLQTFRFIM